MAWTRCVAWWKAVYAGNGKSFMSTIDSSLERLAGVVLARLAELALSSSSAQRGSWRGQAELGWAAGTNDVDGMLSVATWRSCSLASAAKRAYALVMYSFVACAINIST